MAVTAPPAWLASPFRPGRPAIMGVLNVTPDSFSDGGQFLSPLRAIARAADMIAEGADILDIGAESTRPYGDARPVGAEEEIARLAPVLPEIVKLGSPVSIDTMKASVARWALDRGVAIVNDVWGLHRDPDMAPLVAEYGAMAIVMHNRPRADATIDIMADIAAFLARSLEIAAQAGVAREASLGRNRAVERRWGPRAVDIDILAYEELSIDEPDLHLPHPRLGERAFVLTPLAEIAPHQSIGGQTIRALAARVDQSGIERLAPRK